MIKFGLISAVIASLLVSVASQTNGPAVSVVNTTVMPTLGELNDCLEERHPFNPFYHKTVYKVGVHATRGLEEASIETNYSFAEYLTVTAGQRFDPPVRFEVVPLFFDGLYKAIDNEELDFVYANPGIYSCIGTEVGATALVTATKRLNVRDKVFDLDVYGGVIATRADRKDINGIQDLKDKVIGAGAIIDLMGGQMQIYEMFKAGMSYVNDPKQVVFTKNQIDVVHGILDGTFDVGFIRTDQIEITTDELGNLLDPDLFKVLKPKIYVMDDGDLFPFLHSTDIFPEWPLASLPSVQRDVVLEVQEALLNYGKYAEVGEQLKKCRAQLGPTICDQREPKDFYKEAPCDTTWPLALLADDAGDAGHFAGFRVARSYFALSSMQQQAGFMLQNDDDEWYCTRPSNLYEGITCPEGYFKRNMDEFMNGCKQVGLNAKCEKKADYDCFCKPCVRAYDVDVYQRNDTLEDDHMKEFYGESLPGCEKMSICGSLQQGETLTFRIYDNMLRDNAKVSVIAHAGENARDLNVRHLDGTYGYEIDITDKRVGVQVIEILVNGDPISQSPIRVMVEPFNCDAVHGIGSHRRPDEEGECICENNTYKMGASCVESEFFFLIIFASVFIFLAGITIVFLGYKKKQSDSIWHVSVDELHFNEPPEVIGQGAFGVVVLGQYRGTKVAVKRVLPPSLSKKASKGSRSVGSGSMGSFQNVSSTGSIEIPANAKKPAPRKGKKDGKTSKSKDARKGVSFDSDGESADIEAPPPKKVTPTQSGSMSKAWEEFLYQDSKYDNALKILESATLSNHGSGSYQIGKYSATGSRSFAVLDLLPYWLRFDEHTRLRREFVNEMRLLSRLRHPCITTVMGAVIAPSTDPMLVMEFMEYGSLYDILRNETMYAGGEIILQVIRDITQGIQFLHASKPPILHGDLKAKNILVDSRFRAKVADFGFSQLKGSKSKNVLQGTPFFMAPEYLRRKSEYTTQCDMYSLGMIFYEIYARQDPFEGEDPRKMLPKICHPRVNKRPTLPAATPPKIGDIIKKCWSANPFFRPTAKDIDYILVEMSSKEAEPLEIEKNEFKEGMQRKPTSLYDVFPKHIADALNAGKRVEPESHDCVSVVFSDIVGFTTISQTFSSLKVCKMLDRLYLAFDALAKKHEVFKVETIGDAYMGVTNLDGSQFDTHVKCIAEFALDIVAAASTILIDDEEPSRGHVRIRCGFHSGPVVSNVIGSLNPRFGLFGDTVNTASRMESNSVEGRVHCTHTSAKLLEVQAPEIACVLRGKINVKGKGKMMTYWVGNPDARAPISLDELVDLDQTENEDPEEAGAQLAASAAELLNEIEDIASDTEHTEENTATLVGSDDSDKGEKKELIKKESKKKDSKESKKDKKDDSSKKDSKKKKERREIV